MRVRFSAALLLLSCPVWAGEYAVFQSGARLRIDRHETLGDTVRLHAGGGTIEMPASEIAAFEPEEHVAPPPATAQPQAAAHTAAPVPTPDAARRLIEEAARKYSIDANLLHSLVKAESGYRQDAVSPKGAIGLMQLMPSTARMYGADPTDAAQNVEAGTRYLAELLLKYNGGVYRALAAYNAGPGAVDRHGDIPPYRETREYVRRVVENWTRATRR